MDYKCADGSYAFKKRTGCGLRLSESAENFDPGNGVRLFSSFYLVLLRFVHSILGEEIHATLKITNWNCRINRQCKELTPKKCARP